MELLLDAVLEIVINFLMLGFDLWVCKKTWASRGTIRFRYWLAVAVFWTIIVVAVLVYQYITYRVLSA